MPSSLDFSALSFLVVDDSPHARSLLRGILNGLGSRKVFEAADGADGLAMLEKHHPDIAIIDWEMPVLDGPEMIRMIRNPKLTRICFTPIILITAHTELRRIKEAQTFGINELLRKPVSARAVWEKVAAIMLHPRPFLRTPTYFGPEPRLAQGAPASAAEPPDVIEHAPEEVEI